MKSVQIEQKTYEMLPEGRGGIARFLTVADIKRSARSSDRSRTEHRAHVRLTLAPGGDVDLNVGRYS